MAKATVHSAQVDPARSDRPLMSHVLLVDDDPKILDLVASYLRGHHFEVSTAANGQEALSWMTHNRADIVLLDIMMPVMDGLETLRQLRKGSNVPVIMLTAQGESTDRIIGLELGADDYLPKPFQSRELLARIRAVLRRSASHLGAGSDPEELISACGIELNVSRREAKHQDELLDLTTTEFEILRVLVGAAGRVISRERLMALARGDEWASFERSVDVHISHLRRKLGDDSRKPQKIKTIRGVGYLVPQ